MSSKEDSVYRRCPTCGWIHEGILSDGKNDLKYSHCCNCFEDYSNFEDTTEEDLKDKFWRELENKNENLSSILTDEEHVRTGGGGEDTTEEDLKNKFWKDLINKPDTKKDTKTVIDKVKDVITKITDDGKNTALLTALLGGLMGLLNGPSGTAPAGYKGTIPKYIPLS